MSKRDPLVVTTPDPLEKLLRASETDPDAFGKNAVKLQATIDAYYHE
jgi:hypothetical protein